MACQEASSLSRQNASIMSRQILIGTLTSRITGTDFAEQVRQHRTGASGAEVRPMSTAPPPAVGAPYFGRNPCVADQAAWWDGFSAACLYHVGRFLRGGLRSTDQRGISKRLFAGVAEGRRLLAGRVPTQRKGRGLGAGESH